MMTIVSKSRATSRPSRRLGVGRALLVTLIALFAVVVIKNAWLSDDAYITFRTVDLFLRGHGLVYNVGERVQSYTHPLWLMLLIPLRAIFGQLYYPTIFAGVFLSLIAVFLLLRRAANSSVAILGIMALACSKAFVDFTTSGLENALSYTLLALFVGSAARADRNSSGLAESSLFAGLAALNRLDTLLLTLPFLAMRAWGCRDSRTVRALVVGFSPLIVWTLFSIVYYGVPVANTAYAKLNTGVPMSVRWAQGATYFEDLLRRDSATALIIIAGVGAALASRKRTGVALAMGVILYMLYILSAGGDFMAGRLFSLPLLIAVALLMMHLARWSARRVGAAALVVLLLSIPSARANLFSGPTFGDVPLVDTPGFGPLPLSLINKDGICDERAFYYQATGLLRPNSSSFPSHQWATQGQEASKQGRKVRLGYAIGMMGYYAGPDVHIIDVNALCDFFLARLPVPRNPVPRIGHFTRALPLGYVESVVSGGDQLRDPGLAEFYRAVQVVTQEPLFSKGRLAAIWKMNTGGYARLIEDYARQNP